MEDGWHYVVPVTLWPVNTLIAHVCFAHNFAVCLISLSISLVARTDADVLHLGKFTAERQFALAVTNRTKTPTSVAAAQTRCSITFVIIHFKSHTSRCY
jgi:hypothetical protein